ncbi:MAG: metal-dependent transcriptional regulator [Candidatus Korarchaeota archaeon]|nr:metal-dependent transcriptional regulator [Candidatus Korarchaeota archaeon]
MSHRREDGSITPGLQEYLTAIYRLKKSGKKVVRVKELAEEMNVRLSSVTDAAKRLSNMGLIHYEKYGYIDLTPRGEEIASSTLQKEETFFRFLTEFLGLDEAKAREEACWMEHGVGDETVLRISYLMSFLRKCVEDFDKKFREYLERGTCSDL